MAKDTSSFSFDLLRFPTTGETKNIFENFPELRQLHITYNSKDDLTFQSTDRFIDHNDFQQWLIRLLNKLGDVRFSYIQLTYSFNKGIPDQNWKKDGERGGMSFFTEFSTEDHNANKFLFDFFTETFYYHFFSSVDVLYKVINKLFSFNFDEFIKDFNSKVLKKLKEKDFDLHNAIDSFIKLQRKNRKFRNDFTHNFAANEVDLRSKQSIKNDRKTVTMMDPSYTTSKELFNEIQKLIQLYTPVLRLLEISISKEIEKYKSKF